jgi:hypothetical protein|tara:strand:- start:20509 stop:21243 length:735 start_codon:yes stop_codon:yes gene_type:complete
MFLPFGLPVSGVIDPEEQMRDFSQALSMLQQIDQHKFKENTFNDQEKLSNELCTIMTCTTDAALKATATQAPKLGSAATGAHADLYQIEYNRGLQEITMEQDWPQWTSKYAELVLIAFSWQWCRRTNASYNSPDGGIIRMQLRIAVDGALQPGTGPFSFPLDGLYRGSGLANRSLFSSCHTVLVLPAGTHRISIFAGQSPATLVTDDLTNDGVKPLDDPPNNEVVLGNRGLIVGRFAMGRQITG